MLPSRQRRTESPRRVDAGKVEIDRRKMHRGLFMYKLERGLHGLGFFFSDVFYHVWLLTLGGWLYGVPVEHRRIFCGWRYQWLHTYTNISMCVCVYIYQHAPANAWLSSLPLNFRVMRCSFGL